MSAIRRPGGRIRRGGVGWCLVGLAAAVARAQNGHALQFDGQDDYVVMGRQAAFSTAMFTVEAWFVWLGPGQPMQTGVGGTFGTPIFAKGLNEADSKIDTQTAFFLGVTPEGCVVGEFEGWEGQNLPANGTTRINPGQWYHVAFTYDGRIQRLYLDGQLEAEQTAYLEPRRNGLEYVTLGTVLNMAGQPLGYFEGLIDEVRVWNCYLDQQQIASNMNVEIDRETCLHARWGLNEGSGSVSDDSTGNGHRATIVGATWVDGAPFNLGAPPLQPVPRSGVGHVGTLDPELRAAVADVDDSTVDVTFYGRSYVRNTSPPFTIIVLPDTQYYSESYPEIFRAQTQWIADNRDALNIVYVAHLGDIVNIAGPAYRYQWDNADAALSILDGVVPYGLSVGNHDQWPLGNPDGTGLFNDYFPVSRYEGRSWYGGHHGSDNDNSFCLFSAAGMDFIAVHLEFDQTVAYPQTIDWADGLLKAHPNRRALIVTHHFLNWLPEYWSVQGGAIYHGLKDNPNLHFQLAGHMKRRERRVDVYNGMTVHTMMSNYQDWPQGGNGRLRILRFIPTSNLLEVKTYSPVTGQYESAPNDQFVIDYNMAVPQPWVELGRQVGIPSGQTAEIIWRGLQPATDYEWYVSVSDGDDTSRGPAWRLTTPARGGARAIETLPQP